MNRRIDHYLFIFMTSMTGALFSTGSSGQVKTKIFHALNVLSTEYPHEKVYLQADRDYYVSGENVWFSACIRYQDQPDTLSKVLHILLENSLGKRILEEKIPVRQGIAKGYIPLADSLMSGNYCLFAFTSWMRNFDPAFLFHKDIIVLNSLDASPTSLMDTSQNDDSVTFFPEGGYLVQGMQCRIAFKATTKEGVPVSVSGKIIDHSGQEVAKISTMHDGMGIFCLSPQLGETYSAVVHFPTGIEKEYTLPMARLSGLVMHISNRQPEEHKIYIILHRSHADSLQLSKVLLVIKDGNRLLMPEISFVNDKAAIAIPTAGLPSGIMYITAFDREGSPLASQLAFVENSGDRLHLHLQIDQLSFAPRGKNTFTLKIPEAVTGHFSVSVTDADLVPSIPEENNIVSYLLMSADLKVPVYHPDWYFQSIDSTHLKALDLVMMTHKWSLFKWKNILENEYPVIRFPLQRSLMIAGQVVRAKNNLPLQNATVIMRYPSAVNPSDRTLSFKTDSGGNFILQGLDFYDTASLHFLSVTDRHGRHPAFKVNLTDEDDSIPVKVSCYAPLVGNEKNPLNNFLSVAGQENKILQQTKEESILLNSVLVKARKLTHLDSVNKNYASVLFTNSGEKDFDIQQYAGSKTGINVLDFIGENIPGIVVEGNSVMYWRLTSGIDQKSLTSLKLENCPAIFINESPIYESGGGEGAVRAIKELGAIPLSDVALIKIFQRGFAGSSGDAPHGAIAVYLMNGNEAGKDHNVSGGIIRHVMGYEQEREFYAPVYDTSHPVNELPDKRITLYWNPALKVGADGKAVFSFYNNDITKKFRVVIEGMDSTGKTGRLEEVVRPSDLSVIKISQ